MCKGKGGWGCQTRDTFSDAEFSPSRNVWRVQFKMWWRRQSFYATQTHHGCLDWHQCRHFWLQDDDVLPGTWRRHPDTNIWAYAEVVALCDDDVLPWTRRKYPDRHTGLCRFSCLPWRWRFTRNMMQISWLKRTALCRSCCLVWRWRVTMNKTQISWYKHTDLRRISCLL